MRPAVLVVDDSLTVRMDLEEALRESGFETTLCGTGAAAREAAASGVFALAILDVMLPDADGVELLRDFRRSPATAKLPIILLSTESEVRDRVRGLRTGADDYIGKPYDRAYLLSKAKELVRRDAPGEADGRPRILLIDDSATIREELRVLLGANGYAVSTAASGEEGLRLAAELRPRAVVVDGELPGIDGATVIRRLRQDPALRLTACILLTGSEDKRSELRALDAGADAYLRKEEARSVILARLAAVLRFSSATPLGTSPTLQGPRKVLVVDQDPAFQQELAAQLRHESCEPILARSGEEALDLLAVQPVDGVLLGQSESGLSGHETCRRIKSSPGWRKIPVVLLSPSEDRKALLEGMDAGADDFIVKSEGFEVLRARLGAQLRRKQFEAESRMIRDQLLQTELEAAEAKAARELAEVRANLLADLEGKNRELEAFSYSVSHDLRAPLRAIHAFSSMVLEDCGDRLDEEGRRKLRIVLDSATKMDHLINDLLAFSRAGRAAMKVGRVDMESLAREVLAEAMAAVPNRRIECAVGPLPPAKGDVSLLRQVLVNLLANAIKYTRPRDPAVIEVGFRHEAQGPVYFVRDNGVGFDSEQAHRLFGVFQRLHSDQEFEGTGVGLALVQRILERHGGRIWPEGAPEAGATFYFTLPPPD